MRLPPPTISGISGGNLPVKGLQSAFPQAPGDEGLMNNLNLQNRGVANAVDYYNNQRADDFNNGSVLADAVHIGQAAQATHPDPRGMDAFTEALKEKGATIGKHSGLDLPNSPVGQPSTLFDLNQTGLGEAYRQAGPIAGLQDALRRRDIMNKQGAV